MPKYTTNIQIEVEAENEEQAVKKIYSKLQEINFDLVEE